MERVATDVVQVGRCLCGRCAFLRLRARDGGGWLDVSFPAPEAHLLARELAGSSTRLRPAHELVDRVIDAAGARLVEVRLLLRDGLLRAELEIEAAGRRHDVPSFLPDAIVLAVRRGLPVMVPAGALRRPEHEPAELETLTPWVEDEWDGDDEEVEAPAGTELDRFREWLHGVTPQDFAAGHES